MLVKMIREIDIFEGLVKFTIKMKIIGLLDPWEWLQLCTGQLKVPTCRGMYSAEVASVIINTVEVLGEYTDTLAESCPSVNVAERWTESSFFCPSTYLFDHQQVDPSNLSYVLIKVSPFFKKFIILGVRLWVPVKHLRTILVIGADPIIIKLDWVENNIC